MSAHDLLWAVIGALAGLALRALMRRVPRAVHSWWLRRFGYYARRQGASLPDDTIVRLVCKCEGREHDGLWKTSWTPRRIGNIDDPDDYQLTRVSDGRQTYAARDAIEVVSFLDMGAAAYEAAKQ